MKLIETHTVPEGVGRVRLSDYLPGRLQFIISRKGIKKAIKKGQVMVDGQTGATGDWVQPGQTIEIYRAIASTPLPLDITIDTIYEDDHLMVINKPAGIPVSGNAYYTITNAIQGKATPSTLPDALPWPHPVHRLDAATSGLLLLAKSQRAQVILGQYFAERKIKKTYQAIVCGKSLESDSIHLPLDGKAAHTTYETLRQAPSLKCDWLSLLSLSPHTGRTHQLRRHLAANSLPILGDKEYTPEHKPLLRQKGLFLCAVGLEFAHPVRSQKLEIYIDPPAKFEAMMLRAGERWQKFR